jgi:hypothetical protein
MISVSGRDEPGKPRDVGHYLLAAARLALGYFLAIVSGAIVLSLLLQLQANFENPHLPHSSTTTVDMIFISAALGAIFGLPYTILGSLAFWFLLPRQTAVFLLIGAFCPIGALLTMDLVFWNTPSWETAIVLCSIPAGLVATYFYGAVGFGQGFGRWRFQ